MFKLYPTKKIANGSLPSVAAEAPGRCQVRSLALLPFFRTLSIFVGQSPTGVVMQECFWWLRGRCGARRSPCESISEEGGDIGHASRPISLPRPMWRWLIWARQAPTPPRLGHRSQHPCWRAQQGSQSSPSGQGLP